MIITLKKWSINTDFIVTIGWEYSDDDILIAAKVLLCTSSMKGSQASGIPDELYIDKEDDVETFRHLMEYTHKDRFKGIDKQ